MRRDEFEELCAKHRRSTLGYLFTCCRDLGLAEDLVQETMLIAFEKRESYFPEADFGAWLISIARNLWLRERSKRKLTVSLSETVENNASILFARELYGEDAWDDHRAALATCLRKLSDSNRKLLDLHFNDGQTYERIARVAGLTVSWVKVRMHRVRKALQECVRGVLRAQESDV